jgi:hypothetical protein
MKLYKLTDGSGRTRNETQWGEGITHSGTGEGPLCSWGWVHAYEHPLLAAFLFPLHVTWRTLRLWEAEGEIVIRDGQLKCGCRTLTTTKEIPLPEISTAQRVKFARLCADAAAACLAAAGWATAARSAANGAANASHRASYLAAKRTAWGAWAKAEYWAAAAAEAAAWAAGGELDLIKLAEEAMRA